MNGDKDTIVAWKVELYVYDLSRGLAKQFSPLIGKQIDGIWHTGIIVYQHEYYFGGGIQWSRPGQTIAGTPTYTVDLGYTQIPQEVFHDFLNQELASRFKPETYSLLNHNCNNFTSECCQFLLGKDIPENIIGLPAEFLSTPLGQMVKPLIDQMEQGMKQSYTAPAFVPWEEANSGARLSLPPMSPNSHTVLTASEFEKMMAEEKAKNKEEEEEEEKKKQTTTKKAVTSTYVLPSKPILSVDKRHKSFETLIKVNSKKSPDHPLSDQDKATLRGLVSHMQDPKQKQTPVPEASFDLFDRLLAHWEDKLCFPVLGLFRLFVLHKDVGMHYDHNTQHATFKRVIQLSTDANKSNPSRLMALCVLSNCSAHERFGVALAVNEEVIESAISALGCTKDKNTRLLGAALLHNASLYFAHDDADGDTIVQTTSYLCKHVQEEKDEQVLERVLQALSIVVARNTAAAVLVGAMEVGLDTPVASVSEPATKKRLQPIVDTIVKHVTTAMSAEED